MWLHNNPSSTHFHRVREQFAMWSTNRNIHHQILPHYSYHCTVSSCQNTMDMLTIPTWRWECVWTTGHVTRVNSPFRHTGDRIFAFQSLNYYAKHCSSIGYFFLLPTHWTSCSLCAYYEIPTHGIKEVKVTLITSCHYQLPCQPYLTDMFQQFRCDI